MQEESDELRNHQEQGRVQRQMTSIPNLLIQEGQHQMTKGQENLWHSQKNERRRKDEKEGILSYQKLFKNVLLTPKGQKIYTTFQNLVTKAQNVMPLKAQDFEKEYFKKLNKKQQFLKPITNIQEAYFFIQQYDENRDFILIKDAQGRVLSQDIVKSRQQRNLMIQEVSKPIKNLKFLCIFDSALSDRNFVNDKLFEDLSKIKNNQVMVYFKLIEGLDQKKKVNDSTKVFGKIREMEANQKKIYLEIKRKEQQQFILWVYSEKEGNNKQYEMGRRRMENLEQKCIGFHKEQNKIKNFVRQYICTQRVTVVESLILNCCLKIEEKGAFGGVRCKQQQKQGPQNQNNIIKSQILIRKALEQINDKIRKHRHQEQKMEINKQEIDQNEDHFVQSMPKSKMCKNCIITGQPKRKRTSYSCMGCNIKYGIQVPLCLDCFPVFHQITVPLCRDIEFTDIRQMREAFKVKIQKIYAKKQRQQEKKEKAERDHRMIQNGLKLGKELDKNFEELYGIIDRLKAGSEEAKGYASKISTVLFLKTLQGLTYSMEKEQVEANSEAVMRSSQRQNQRE